MHEIVRRIAEECIRRGARSIGHIKTYLRTESGYVRADTIGVKYGVNVENNIKKPEREASLTINSIVIGLNEREVTGITLNITKEVLKSTGFSILGTDEEHRLA
ncbi:MAG: hypothetical protein NZ992_03695 [Candidatus Korarchaeum sp.]|nr:hypothetical protein [Candidatus Korarchaeum sp.]